MDLRQACFVVRIALLLAIVPLATAGLVLVLFDLDSRTEEPLFLVMMSLLFAAWFVEPVARRLERMATAPVKEKR